MESQGHRGPLFEALLITLRVFSVVAGCTWLDELDAAADGVQIPFNRILSTVRKNFVTAVGM